MKLTVAERIVLLSILPEEGNFATLKILRKLKDEVGFGEEELQLYEIRPEGEMILWDATKEPDGGVELEIGPAASAVVVEALQNLDKEGKLADRHFTLYEKFVDG